MSESITAEPEELSDALFKGLNIARLGAPSLPREGKIGLREKTFCGDRGDLGVTHRCVDGEIGTCCRNRFDLARCSCKPVKDRANSIISEEFNDRSMSSGRVERGKRRYDLRPGQPQARPREPLARCLQVSFGRDRPLLRVPSEV